MTAGPALAQAVIAASAAVAGAVLSSGASFLHYRNERSQLRASGDQQAISTARSLTETSLALLEPVKAAAKEFEAKAAVLQTQLHEAEGVVLSLAQSLAQMTSQATVEREELVRSLEKAASETERMRQELAARETELAAYRRGAAP